MIMCIQILGLIGLFVFKILSKNSILTLIKGRNSIANLPKFELIQALMHVLVTCKNEEDQTENEKNLIQPFPHPNDGSDKISLRLAHWLRRYSSLKMFTHRHTDDSSTGIL